MTDTQRTIRYPKVGDKATIMLDHMGDQLAEPIESEVTAVEFSPFGETITMTMAPGRRSPFSNHALEDLSFEDPNVAKSDDELVKHGMLKSSAEAYEPYVLNP